jgi:hypothetical protein
MALCICHIAAEFPILEDSGIISANLRTNTDVIVTEGGLVLYGPAFGDLSVTAYALLESDDELGCPGKAGVSYNWDKRYDCDTPYNDIQVYFIPRGRSRSYRDGDVTNKISLTPLVNYKFFSASAASGPYTPYLLQEHTDAYNFIYTGSPISIVLADAYNNKHVGLFDDILPTGSHLYLQSFSWNFVPPNVPTVSYSFLFTYSENT